MEMKRWRERVVVIGRIALDMVDWNVFFDRNGAEVAAHGVRVALYQSWVDGKK